MPGFVFIIIDLRCRFDDNIHIVPFLCQQPSQFGKEFDLFLYLFNIRLIFYFLILHNYKAFVNTKFFSSFFTVFFPGLTPFSSLKESYKAVANLLILVIAGFLIL